MFFKIVLYVGYTVAIAKKGRVWYFYCHLPLKRKLEMDKLDIEREWDQGRNVERQEIDKSVRACE